MEQTFLPQRAEDFLRRWFAALEELTPQESVNLLAGTTVENFTELLRVSLPPEEFGRLTTGEILGAHEGTCDRLMANATYSEGVC